MTKMCVVSHQVERVEPMEHMRVVVNTLAHLNSKYSNILETGNDNTLCLLLIPETYVFESVDNIPYHLKQDDYTIAVTYINPEFDKPEMEIRDIKKQTIEEYVKWKEIWSLKVIKETFIHTASVSKFLLADLPDAIVSRIKVSDTSITIRDLENSGILWNQSTLSYEVQRRDL